MRSNVSAFCLAALAGACLAPPACPVAAASRSASPAVDLDPCVAAVHAPLPASVAALQILGLVSPAVVSGSIAVSVAGSPVGSTIAYCLNGAWLRGNSVPAHSSTSVQRLSLRSVLPGRHQLQALSVTGAVVQGASSRLLLTVIPANDSEFSRQLVAYPRQAVDAVELESLSAILKRTATPGDELTAQESATRASVAAMYLNFGFDVALDAEVDLSTVLPALLPSAWAPPPTGADLPLSMRFSPDSPYYHPIPASTPRVLLPAGYIKTVQVNTSQGGDGIGFGIAVAQADSPQAVITSMWHTQSATRRTIAFKLPVDWQTALPPLRAGDEHVIFVALPAVSGDYASFVSAYKTSVDPRTGNPNALYAGDTASFDSLGDHGGSVAPRFAELPLLIQAGEATDADMGNTADSRPIRHAIGGSVARPWAARVYPATARDYGMMTSTDPCTGKGAMNTGLVPYGGVIQLDPQLDLGALGLTRPALRILRAMQVYGYYVMDYGCTDLDIYTAVSEKDLMPYGGLYGYSRYGPGIQNEITRVVTSSKLYVVPPLTKRP